MIGEQGVDLKCYLYRCTGEGGGRIIDRSRSFDYKGFVKVWGLRKMGPTVSEGKSIQ